MSGSFAVQLDSSKGRLYSWKEIAAYFKREVRTVQRWEKLEGLPVQRHLHTTHGSVYADRRDLDAWWKRQALPTHRTMLAVLPFENLGGDPEQEYFSDGLSEELIAQLGRLHPAGLGVVARTSSMYYKHAEKTIKEIANELRVDYILEGGVHRAGKRIRITARLIQTSDQTQLWAEIYERDEEDVFDLQNDVTKRIARSLAVELIPEQQLVTRRRVTCDPAAHEAYLKGRYCWNKMTADGFSRAIGYFEQAIGSDCDYALAYSGLADCYTMVGFYDIDSAVGAMTRARSAATKALELDETLGEAHASLAHVLTFFDWDWTGGEREYLRAIELCPNYPTAYRWYGDYLTIRSRHDEAVEQVERALELDPVSLIINVWLGMTHFYSGQYDRAIKQCGRALDIDPDYALARRALGVAYQASGMHQAAVKELETAVCLSGDSLWMTAELGCAYAAADRKDEALDILVRLQDQSKQTGTLSFNIAMILVALNHIDEAFAWLEKAGRDRSLRLAYVAVDPRASRLRCDARFRLLLSRMCKV